MLEPDARKPARPVLRGGGDGNAASLPDLGTLGAIQVLQSQRPPRPPTPESFPIGKQMIRSADSIGVNSAEGQGRGSYADNRRLVRISRASLYETRHWLRRAYRRKLLTQEQVEQLKNLVATLGPQLNAYLKSIGSSRT